MLFNSVEFVLIFLPLVVGGFHILRGRASDRTICVYLFLCSLAFYAWWEVRNLPLILASIMLNYAIGRRIEAVEEKPSRRTWLIIGVCCNLAILGYFKYAGFLASIAGLDYGVDGRAGVALPLAISFFTFLQIGYLVDTRRGASRRCDPTQYGLFVTFFPHLIAGPLVHHSELIPQFRGFAERRLRVDTAAGLTLFGCGLLKKVLLADTFASYASPLFDAAASGVVLTWAEAWLAALAYSFQIYFDFSGYSDMALGLALLFGIRFPLNFNSPYKATGIADFWRRWHMTLSRFLKECLYIPLGGNRLGFWRELANVMIVMLLGGLWHGASWNFVAWGGLHGAYLVGERLVGRWRGDAAAADPTPYRRWRSRAITLLLVVLAWVLFRAPDMTTAVAMWWSMFGLGGLDLPVSMPDWARISGGGYVVYEGMFRNGILPGGVMPAFAWLALGLAICWWAPNSQEILGRFRVALDSPASSTRWQWRLSAAHGMVAGGAVLAGVLLLASYSEFIYFRF